MIGRRLVAVGSFSVVVLLAGHAHAAVLCAKGAKIKIRASACKGKETVVQDLGDLAAQLSGLGTQVTGLGTQVTGIGTQVNGLGAQVTGIDGEVETQTTRIDLVSTQLRLECPGAPSLQRVPNDESFFHDNIDCGGGCRTLDGNQAGCEAAFALSDEGATSCFFVNGLCYPCQECGTRAGGGVCLNRCSAPAPPCPDPTRTVFVGGPRTDACRGLGTQAACEMAYHRGRGLKLGSCYWDGSQCNGCGPSNEHNGNCTNTCRTDTCADATRTTLRRCSNIGSDQPACLAAWHLARIARADPSSCFFDVGGNQCRGCGPIRELRGECSNSCR